MNTFEFDCNSTHHRLRFDGPGEPVKFERKSTIGNWGSIYTDATCRAVGIRDLMDRDAQWREAWTELMVLARLLDEHLLTGNMKQTKFTGRINDLQRRVDAMGG